MQSIESEPQPKSRIRRFASLVGSSAEMLGLSNGQQEFEPYRKAQLERYVGRLILVAGDHHDGLSLEESVASATTNLKHEGLLQPGITLGLHSILLDADPMNSSNHRLLKVEDRLRGAIKDRYAKIARAVCGQAHVRSGGGPESDRSYDALTEVLENFEIGLGYTLEAPPRESEVGLVAVVNARWASRVFRGVHYDNLAHSGGLVTIRQIGDKPADTLWSPTEPSRLEIPVHD